MKNYERLDAFKHIKLITKDIYRVTEGFPSGESNNLKIQLRRASVSALSNLVEGASRQSFKEKVRFIEISYGSLLECDVQLLLSYELGISKLESITPIRSQITRACKMLSGLRNHFLKP
jgi:four helix bundle protein